MISFSEFIAVMIAIFVTYQLVGAIKMAIYQNASLKSQKAYEQDIIYKLMELAQIVSYEDGTMAIIVENPMSMDKNNPPRIKIFNITDFTANYWLLGGADKIDDAIIEAHKYCGGKTTQYLRERAERTS